MNALYDSRKIARAAGERQCEGALKFSGLSIDLYGMLGRGAQKKSNGYFSTLAGQRKKLSCAKALLMTSPGQQGSLECRALEIYAKRGEFTRA